MECSRKIIKPVAPASPHLQRSKSSAPAISRTSTPDAHLFPSNLPTFPISRSNSTSKTRPKVVHDDDNHIPKIRKPPDAAHDNPAGILHRLRTPDAAANAAKPRKARSVAASPSAWALSPGRSPAQESSERSRGGGVSGVLRFFRQKKAPSAREEAAHQLRILQARLIQWRFVNARAEAAVAAGKSKAEKKLFNVWLENFQLRTLVTEKRIQIEKIKEEIKLNGILQTQMPLLNKWEKIDKRNLEGITKSARVLRAMSTKVPLLDGAKADIFSVYTTICTATDVMESIEATISRFYVQVENMSSLLTELVKIVNQENECMEELMQISATVASLQAKERSLRVLLIQSKKDRRAPSYRGFCRLSNRTEDVSFQLQATLSKCNHSFSQTSKHVH